MESLNDGGQWIVMMGFVVSIGIFFLALILSQSTLVGQTTAEGVLEFPKNDVQDLRSEIFEIAKYKRTLDAGVVDNNRVLSNMSDDVEKIAFQRKSALVSYTIGNFSSDRRIIMVHYNNGVFEYNETIWAYY